MANKILVARGTKARIETIKETLETYELVYATDTGELGVKKANGNIEYFKNATDIDAIEGEVIQLQTDIADKVDKITGKGLSTNDYTDAEKTKLAGIEEGAEKNTVNSVNGKTGTVVINKSDVGLSNADDTADLDKPISTATQTALNLKADKTQLNNYVTTSTFDMQMLEKLGIKPNGTDLLIIDGMINPLYIDDTSYKVNHPTVNSQAEMLALDVPLGTVVVRLDTPSKELFLLTQLPASTLANWQLVSSNTVVSVAGKTGAVVLGITDISGLNSALNLKLDITTFESQITQLQDDIDSKADKSELFSKNYNDLTNKPALKPVATSGDYNDLTNKPSIPTIPSILSTSEGNTGTSTTQRTINAKNLKDIILNHSPAGARPASDVSSWAKASTKPTYTAAEVGARPDNWTPSWSQVSGKPSWIGSSKPTYNLGEISETTTYKRVTQSEKDTWNGKLDRHQFEVGSSDGQRRYFRLFTIDGVASSAGGYCQAIITGDGDFGNYRRGVVTIFAAQRGDNGFYLNYYKQNADDLSDPVILYYKQVSTYVFEVWGLFADYNDTRSFYELGSKRTTINLDSATTTAPTGLVAGVQFTEATREWVTANTRSNTWTPTWSQVSGKPSWIGSSKPTYNLGEISETTTYKRFTQTEKTKLNGIETGAQVNRTIATTTQAEAGTNNTTVMTPLRVKEAFIALLKNLPNI